MFRGNRGRRAFSMGVDFVTKHFGRKGGGPDAHHNRLTQYHVNTNTFGEELPQTTTQFSLIDKQGVTWFPTPNITETKRTGKIGVQFPPQEHGAGYMGFKPIKGGTDMHYVGKKTPTDFYDL